MNNYTHTNCPNCNAPITGAVCEYCGTSLTGESPRSIEQRIEFLRRKNEFLLAQLSSGKVFQQDKPSPENAILDFWR